MRWADADPGFTRPTDPDPGTGSPDVEAAGLQENEADDTLVTGDGLAGAGADGGGGTVGAGTDGHPSPGPTHARRDKGARRASRIRSDDGGELFEGIF
ncbi:MAG: hypothetical protein ACRDOE_00500 [Streptosporangiaceae bacterium]